MTKPTKEEIAAKARKYVEENALILDTETTGLDEAAEIVEIAICDARGLLEFSALVKPTRPIPEGAAKVHGITDEMVANARPWPQVQNMVHTICWGRTVLAFNADYDSRLVRQTAALCASPLQDSPIQDWGCLMLAYQYFAGLYRWPRLAAACEAIGYTFEGNAHRAMADAKAARAVLLHMANYRPVEQPALIEVPAPVGVGYLEGE